MIVYNTSCRPLRALNVVLNSSPTPCAHLLFLSSCFFLPTTCFFPLSPFFRSPFSIITRVLYRFRSISYGLVLIQIHMFTLTFLSHYLCSPLFSFFPLPVFSHRHYLCCLRLALLPIIFTSSINVRTERKKVGQ